MKNIWGFRDLILHRTSRNWPAILCVVLVLLLFTPATVHAQGLSGMTGTVTDETGAVIPDAKVTVTNTATNVVHTAVTTSEGTYFINRSHPWNLHR